MASVSANLTAAVLSQAAAAASSQALAEASSSTDTGSQVGILAQVIIAIGVLPIELIIIAIVLGIHRLAHRRPSRPLQTVVNSVKPTQDSLPYLQPKAELEDEQKKTYELHGEHVENELEGQDAIVQIADDTDSLVLPLQGTHGVHEMPEEKDISWEMADQERNELMGDEYARELPCPFQGEKESIETQQAKEPESPVKPKRGPKAPESVQELEFPIHATSESIVAEDPLNPPALCECRATESANINPTRSHFMLRQQEMAEMIDPMATNQCDGSKE